MLFLDRVIELEEATSARAIKNVSINEPYFQGHFPEKFIMPGSYLIEASAQLCALLFTSGGEGSASIGYLASVDHFKFILPVVPGDQLVLTVSCTGGIGEFKQARVEIEREGEIVANGTLLIVPMETN